MVSGFVFGERGCKRTGLSQEEKNLQAALDLIVKQGYYGASIKGITARVGISKAVPYSYFKTKGELVLGLVEEYKTRFVDEVVRIKDEHQDMQFRGLDRIIRLYTQCGLEHLELLLFFRYISNALSNDPDHAYPGRNRAKKETAGPIV